MKVRDIVKITGGKLLSGDPAIEVEPSKISTDSRTINKSEFFIALSGANFDGNCFIEEAFKKGAIGALSCPRKRASIQALDSRLRGKDKKNNRNDKILIQVSDTTKALQDIAAYHRKKFRIPVVCITGSNGKTTVKDMSWHLLSSKYNVLRSEGTKNNHIGVPQTLLKLNPSHQICVLELGTNHKGEIALLSAIARPTVAVITGIGPSHLEFFGDLKGVFEAKKEILKYLDNRRGILILNGDDRFLSNVKSGKSRIIRYGFKDSNDLAIEALTPKSANLTFIVNNRMLFGLNLLGAHNIYNAVAAIAVALRFGISYKAIREAFQSYRPAYMRLELEKVSGVDILNDSYNSNPASMMRALETIAYYPANSRWVVSGDMLELGRDGERFHRMIGSSIARSNCDGLITFGELSKHTLAEAKALGMRRDRLWHCSTHDEIAGLLKKITKSGDVVLLKGSRSMQIEKVLQRLKD